MNRTITRLTTGLIAACAIVAPDVRAGDCPGDPGLVLDISPELVPIGTAFTVDVTAPAGSLVVLLQSGNPGPSVTSYGTLCVGAPPMAFPFVMPAANFVFPHFIACEPSFIGIKGYFQFLNFSTMNGTFLGKSNPDSIEIVDGACSATPGPGDFFTGTQGGWGQRCNGSNLGCLRDAHFAAVFPNGLVLGDPDGADADTHWSLTLTTAGAVAAYLPAGKKPRPLAADHVDPLVTEAGNLGGQLAAAKLNVGFDAAGIFDTRKSDPSILLSDLVFVAYVHPALIGKTVAEVIALGDQLLSTELAGPATIEGQVVELSDVADALDAFNNDFVDGEANGALGVPHVPGP